ncbi:hypothetical protein BCR36DRAFT_396175 [Piromyces finnis]|uniref:XRCC4 N-terminal domain-containing protein n=1 Tax=Piromyces finnis TaxID=1754191 RepID=A0A1Y1VH23_9FUNG|nr:hypothetical protein BCR36DRAFT_396175 [Piromyces finnis]|eukprot:ORX54760.1 hypothetical protein BCR36DRAFT_396175 [Piromyces finnis]
MSSSIKNNKYHFFKLENDELNNNKIYIWTYWKLNIDNIENKNFNNNSEVFEIIISDGERLWNQTIKVKDILSYVKNIKEKDYYELMKKALSYTIQDKKEKFLYNWNLKDDISNFSIKLEISNSNNNSQNKFQYHLGNIDLLPIKKENKKKIYQLIYDDTINEYQKLKDENSLLSTANASLQKVQKEFSEQMEEIIKDKKKIEEFRELLNEKKRKIKNLMTTLKRKEEIINEYKRLNENQLNNSNEKVFGNNNEINNSDNSRKRKRTNHMSEEENEYEYEKDRLLNNKKSLKKGVNIDSKSNEKVVNEFNIDSNNDIDKFKNNNKKLNNNEDDDDTVTNNSSSNNNENNNMIKKENNSDSDSDISVLNLIPNIEVRTYTGSNKLPTLNNSVGLISLDTPSKTKNQKNNKDNKIKNDDSSTDDDIDKLLDMI